LSFFLHLKYKQIIGNLTLLITPDQEFCFFPLAPQTKLCLCYGLLLLFNSGIDERGGEGRGKSYCTSLACLLHPFIEEEDGKVSIHNVHLCCCGNVHVLSLKVDTKVSIVCAEN
jgi:hypothetical protein